MKDRDRKTERLLKACRDAYFRQPSVSPHEEWIGSVMAAVRRESIPVCRRSGDVEQTAWRLGWVVALAASILAVVSLVAMPSHDRLAWDLYKGGAMAQMAVRMGE